MAAKQFAGKTCIFIVIWYEYNMKEQEDLNNS